MTGDLFSVHLVRCVDYKNDARWNHPINLYPYDTLYFVLDGDGFVRIGDTTTALEAGWVYLIPANTLYACWCETAIHKVYAEILAETLPGMGVFAGLHALARRPYARERVRELSGADRSTLKGRMWFQGELLRVISMFIDEAWQPPDRSVLRFKPILDDIARNLASDLRLGDIARQYGWHPSALSRAFRAAFGCTLKQYVDLLLLNKLRQELIVTDKRLGELAAEYRFCDGYYLSAFFKKRAGISPEQYRKGLAKP